MLRPVYPDGSHEGTVMPKAGDQYVSSSVDEAKPDWHEDAACRGEPISKFDPDLEHLGRPSGVSAQHRGHWVWREALAICEHCPVVGECLEYGLSSSEARRFGVLGNTIPAERTKMR